MKRRGLFRVSHSAPPALLPEDQKAKEILNEAGKDKRLLVSVHSARYPEHNGLVFMVLQMIADATGYPLRAVILSLLHEAGRFDYVKLLDKSLVVDPHSLSPESMSQEDFSQFWDETADIVKTKWRGLMSQKDYDAILETMKPKQ